MNKLDQIKHNLERGLPVITVDSVNNPKGFIIIEGLHNTIKRLERERYELEQAVTALNNAINFALDICDSDPLAFLHLWREGDFESCKAEWGYENTKEQDQ